MPIPTSMATIKRQSRATRLEMQGSRGPALSTSITGARAAELGPRAKTHRARTQDSLWTAINKMLKVAPQLEPQEASTVPEAACHLGTPAALYSKTRTGTAAGTRRRAATRRSRATGTTRRSRSAITFSVSYSYKRMIYAI